MVKIPPAICIPETYMREHFNSFCEVDQDAVLKAIQDFMVDAKDHFDYAEHRVKVTLVPGSVQIVKEKDGTVVE